MGHAVLLAARAAAEAGSGARQGRGGSRKGSEVINATRSELRACFGSHTELPACHHPHLATPSRQHPPAAAAARPGCPPPPRSPPSPQCPAQSSPRCTASNGWKVMGISSCPRSAVALRSSTYACLPLGPLPCPPPSLTGPGAWTTPAAAHHRLHPHRCWRQRWQLPPYPRHCRRLPQWVGGRFRRVGGWCGCNHPA